MKSTLNIEEPDLNFLTLYLYSPTIKPNIIKGLLSLYPWFSITKNQLKNNINTRITNQDEKKLCIKILEKQITAYQKLSSKNQDDRLESTTFNLLLLTAFELLHCDHPSVEKHHFFFYQLFFNSSLHSSLKNAFFHHLIEFNSTISGIKKLIGIPLDSLRFQIDSQNLSCDEWCKKLSFCDNYLKNKALIKLGFSPEKIHLTNQDDATAHKETT